MSAQEIIITGDPMGCGHKLHVGDRVYSHYTMSAGVIENPSPTFGEKDVWFDLRHDDGKASLLNGDRVACLACAKKYGYPNAE